MGERERFRRFVGVSLGGGRGKTTAIARLEEDVEAGFLRLVEARVRQGHRGGGGTIEKGEDSPFRDEVLVSYLERWVDESCAVAFDTPLTLPPCVRCQLSCPGVEACEVPVVQWMRRHASSLVKRGQSDPKKPRVTPYTQRATELLLEGITRQPREALGQGMGPLAARSIYLRRRLSPVLRLHENLIEVHPRATLIRLFGSEAERRTRQGERLAVWEKRKGMLQGLTAGLRFERVWPELVVRNINVFHAVIIAFTAYAWAREEWRAPGRGKSVQSISQGENADGATPEGDLEKALRELGTLWLEDGWIWTPPPDTKKLARKFSPESI